MDQKESEEFIKLLKIDWSEAVTRIAQAVLNERRLNKSIELPDPQDVKRLSEFTVTELKKLDFEDKSEEVFRRAVTLAETRLLVFNKRRSGELEATL